MPTYPARDDTPLHHDLVGGGSGEPLVVIAGGACLPPGYLEDLAGLADVRPLVVGAPAGGRGIAATGRPGGGLPFRAA